MDITKNFKILGSIILIIGLLVFIGIIFISTNQNIASKDIKNLENIANTITTTNFSNDLNNQISSDNFTKSLEKKVSKFKDIQLNLSSLDIDSNYDIILTNLNEGLSLNIDFYEQLISILKSPNSMDLQTSYDAAINLKEQCENKYKACSKNNMNLSLTNNNEYLNKILYYINQLIKISRDSDINTEQKNDFIISIDKIYRGFLPLTEDLLTTIDLIKKDGRDINLLTSDIHNKLIELQNIENDFFNLSIPSNGTELFKAFENCLKTYENYINNLLKGIMAETSENNSNTSNEDFYNKAKSNYDELIKTLNNFDSTFSKYKNN
ncbi:hypothetical protein [Clostridium tarantellae]|uniref:DUF3829 domain-containing protein n=1 Tax=Clostridium tarantellae TaxID=39493 RepID=A0A6I1MMH9_9CLOT|nr:hypothetical protein [Clostridium tarantellae]MPQ43327.1 hypothetical protein [Clostridium tarantellae]